MTRIAVVGLWHLGTVTAACLASAGHDVIAVDDDPLTIEGIREGRLPVNEPGLAGLIRQGIEDGHLGLASEGSAIVGADLVWITYDTPVDDSDHADVQFVTERISRLFPYLCDGTTILISSQLPVGTTRRLESEFRGHDPRSRVSFSYSPENLRLGQAIDSFRRRRRVAVGVREDTDRLLISSILEPFAEEIQWMSVESAEMAKHALNAFLATSVAFANELAVLCEQVGADARDIERALRGDERVGGKAYVRAGAGFAGGTLGRDVSYLGDTGRKLGVPTYVLDGVCQSNAAHLSWVRNVLGNSLDPLEGRHVALLGLTYKPGTDTLRRSSAVEISQWLVSRGVVVTAFDPAVSTLPPELTATIVLRSNVEEAVRGSDAVVVATEWPEFTRIQADDLIGWMRGSLIVDPGRFLEPTFAECRHMIYRAVGISR